MSESPIKGFITQEDIDMRQVNLLKKRNSSEPKKDNCDKILQNSTQKKKFCFKAYIKNKIAQQMTSENQNETKLEKKDSTSSKFVQHLIDLKQQIQQNNFLYHYKEKYFIAEENKNDIISKNALQKFDSANNNNIVSANNLDKSNNIQLNQQELKIEKKKRKSQFRIDQFPQKIYSDQNKESKDLLQYQSIVQSLSKQDISEGTKILKQLEIDRQSQSQKLIKAKPEQNIHQNISQPQSKKKFGQKQSEKVIKIGYENLIRKSSKDIQEGYSSGEEFNLSMIPKSKLIFKIQSNIPPSFSYQQIPETKPSRSRQSLDINYLSSKRIQKMQTPQEDKLNQPKSQNSKLLTNVSETSSHNENLKHLTIKRKFASENLKDQQIKNLQKLIPQAFVKVYRKQGVNSLPRKRQFLENKTNNSQMSINQLPNSSEGTDIDTNDVTLPIKSSQNRCSTTSIQANKLAVNIHNKKQDLDYETLRIVAKNNQKNKKVSKQCRSKSINNSIPQKIINQQESQVQEQNPQINILLCSSKNAKNNYNALNKLLSYSKEQQIFSQESLNNLSSIINSNQESNHASPINISNNPKQIEKQLTLSLIQSSNNPNSLKMIKTNQTDKFNHYDQIMKKKDDNTDKKSKFVNYYLLNSENSKRFSSPLKQQRYSSKQKFITQNSQVDLSIKSIYNNTQMKEIEHKQTLPIKIQSLTYTSSCSSSHQQNNLNCELKLQIKSLKYLNACQILETVSKQKQYE